MEETQEMRSQQENTEAEEIAEVAPSELEVLEEKYKNLEQDYLRTHADFENIKKRLEREKYQALEYCYEGIAKDLLPIVDTLEKAVQSAEGESALEALIEGIKLTQENLLKVLSKHGIERIPSEGIFDPQLHEAIMQQSAEGKADGEIVQTFQQGYKYKERTLRPAMVCVAKN